jgi:hypothetical protein
MAVQGLQEAALAEGVGEAEEFVVAHVEEAEVHALADRRGNLIQLDSKINNNK